MPLSSTWESLTWASAVASSLTAQRDRSLLQLRLRLLVDRRSELADLAGQHDQVERADRRRLRLVADGVDGAADAGDALAQALPERPQLAAVVGQRRRGSRSRIVDDVEQAVEIAFEEGRRRHRPFVAGGRHGDQVAGEIAAVDARHVERKQRPQRPACRTSCRDGRDRSPASRSWRSSLRAARRRWRARSSRSRAPTATDSR